MAASSDDPGPSGERRFEIKSLGELGIYIYIHIHTHIYIYIITHAHIYASPSPADPLLKLFAISLSMYIFFITDHSHKIKQQSTLLCIYITFSMVYLLPTKNLL